MKWITVENKEEIQAKNRHWDKAVGKLLYVYKTK